MLNRVSMTSGLAVLAAWFMAMAPSPAHADGTVVTNCLYGRGGVSCVKIWRDGVQNPHIVHVPGPRSQADKAETAAREELWLARCRPYVRQDGYGVARYHYAAPGCEFGRYE